MNTQTMTCKVIMTPNPQCCTPQTTVQDVAQMMKSVDAGSVPVVESESNRQIVGIVTDRDLALKVVGEGRDPKTTRVQDVMSPDVVTCNERDSLDKAMQAMSDYQIRRIPVINDRKVIVGVIAQADVATRTEQPMQTAEVVEEISQSNGSI